jgi:hypothetical protein
MSEQKDLSEAQPGKAQLRHVVSETLIAAAAIDAFLRPIFRRVKKIAQLRVSEGDGIYRK